jgi:hypothetical protein
VRRALDGPDAHAHQRLRAHVPAMADATASDVCLRGCLLAKGTAELSEHDPAVAATGRRTFAAIEEPISSCVAGAQRAGDIQQDADPARLAGLLLAVLRGIEALGEGGSSPDSPHAIAETALALLPLPQDGHGRDRKAAPRTREQPPPSGSERDRPDKCKCLVQVGRSGSPRVSGRCTTPPPPVAMLPVEALS